MREELTPEQKFAAEDAEMMVPTALVRGRNPADIVADLIRLDWSPDAASALVDRVADDLQRFHESPESRKQLVRDARKQFVAGLALALLAACVTPLTYIAALTGLSSIVVGTR